MKRIYLVLEFGYENEGLSAVHICQDEESMMMLSDHFDNSENYNEMLELDIEDNMLTDESIDKISKILDERFDCYE